MAAEWRRIEVARGHTLLARRAPRQSARPGRVTLIVRHRDPIEVEETIWNAGEVHHGRDA